MISTRIKGAVIALGTFDGMHPGHQAVIDRAVKRAGELGVKSMAFTFRNIPKSLFKKDVDQLMPPEEKERLMHERGIDHVVLQEFSEAFSLLTPREFIEGLVTEYEPKAVVTGEDYRFGCKASGNTEMLKAFGKEMGFEVITVGTVRMVLPDGSLGGKISSTDIRSAIRQNRMELAEALMKGKIAGDE